VSEDSRRKNNRLRKHIGDEYERNNQVTKRNFAFSKGVRRHGHAAAFIIKIADKGNSKKKCEYKLEDPPVCMYLPGVHDGCEDSDQEKTVDPAINRTVSETDGKKIDKQRHERG
jgi:hypothetical protein